MSENDTKGETFPDDFPLAQFQHGKILGSGGFGNVQKYSLRHPDESMPADVAVKTFKQDR